MGGGGKVAKVAGALGERGNPGVTVGDGFVPGRLNAGGEVLCWVNGALFHPAILAWGLRRRNFTTEIPEGTEFGGERKPARLYSFGGATTRETLKSSGVLFRII